MASNAAPKLMLISGLPPYHKIMVLLFGPREEPLPCYFHLCFNKHGKLFLISSVCWDNDDLWKELESQEQALKQQETALKGIQILLAQFLKNQDESGNNHCVVQNKHEEEEWYSPLMMRRPTIASPRSITSSWRIFNPNCMPWRTRRTSNEWALFRDIPFYKIR